MNTQTRVHMNAAIFAIDRLRMGTDGRGLTTLVCFMSCPLRCAFCLNDRCHANTEDRNGQRDRSDFRFLSPEGLYEMVKIDNLYFQATGGGICFGGGEPAQFSGFIEEFRKICHPSWKITIETALACSMNDLRILSEVVDHWIIDTKDMNKSIYKEYTGKDSFIAEKLKYLASLNLQDKITIKVPLIPHFNTEADRKASIRILKDMEFTDIKKIDYLPIPSKYASKNSNV